MRLNESTITIIRKLLIARKSRSLLVILGKLTAMDHASVYSILPSREARWLFEAILQAHLGPAFFQELTETQQSQIIAESEDQKLKLLLSDCDDQMAAEILKLIPADRQQSLLQIFQPERQNRIEKILRYPENSAGRMMDTQIFSLPWSLTAQQALDKIRDYAQISSIYYLYIVDERDVLQGVVSLRVLVTSPPQSPLKTLIRGDLVSVKPETTVDEVAREFNKYGYIALPVVNEQGRFMGTLTVDDVLDRVQESAEAKIYAQVGLQEDERVYTPIAKSFKNRFTWMLVNLGLAAVASVVVSVFETTMSAVIVLASLNNIVSGIGGNTGVQSLAVVLRGISLGDFEIISQRKALIKETLVGLSLGAGMGTASGILVYFWKGSSLAALAIGISMVLNCLWAGLIGAAIPMVLTRMGRDPAIASTVIITTLTDIFGFFSFLGTASLLLKIL